MLIRKIIVLLFVSGLFGSAYISEALAQADEATEPTTASSVVDAVLPWGAQRILPAKVPAEFNALFDKLLAEGGGNITSGRREILAWQGNYANRSKADALKIELRSNFRKEGWVFHTAAIEGEVELFGLSREGSDPRAILGFFVSNKEVLVCALMEIQKADRATERTDTRVPTVNASGGSIVGKWFRTIGGSTIDWTGKTTLKGGEDFIFEFFADGSVEYTRKKEILNVMQCRIKADDNARGQYTLHGSTLTINLGAMRSTGSNSCNTRENYNKTLGPSSMTAQIQIKQADDITRPDRPYTMCFDAGDVCYEKQQ